MDSETLNSHSKSSPPPPHFDYHKRLDSMFCSVRTNARSSNWLRRLRSSRGYPNTDKTNAGQFLDTYRKHTTKRPNRVLSDPKFHDLSRIERRKNRKQQFPKKYVVSTNSDRASSPLTSRLPTPLPWPPPLPLPLPMPSPLPLLSPLPSPSPSPLLSLLSLLSPWPVKRKRTAREFIRVLNMEKRVEEEEENGDWNLSRYSKTEVTIIDTSDPSWKLEKMLYRRKNVWKIGDKNGKGLMLMTGEGKGSMSGDSKKRNKSVKENVDVHKKRKVCTSTNSLDAEEGGKKKKSLKLCNSSKSVQGHDRGKTMAASFEKKQDK